MEDNELFIEVEEEQIQKRSFPFWKILYSNLLFIIIAAILAGGIGLAIGYFKAKPVYTAQSDVMLKLSLDASGYSNDQLISTNMTLAKSSLRTISDTISSSDLLEKASSYNGYDIKASNIKVNYNVNSLAFKISYTDSAPDMATEKLVDVIKATQEQLVKRKPVVFTDIKLVETRGKFTIYKTDKRITYVIVGAAIGVAAVVVAAFLRYFLDNKVKTKEELEELTGTIVLSFIDKQ